jgi:hypothetical protein
MRPGTERRTLAATVASMQQAEATALRRLAPHVSVSWARRWRESSRPVSSRNQEMIQGSRERKQCVWHGQGITLSGNYSPRRCHSASARATNVSTSDFIARPSWVEVACLCRHVQKERPGERPPCSKLI